MKVRAVERILAVVTTDPARVAGGGAPVFVATDPEELERMALLLSRVTLGMAHEIAPGTYVIMKH